MRHLFGLTLLMGSLAAFGAGSGPMDGGGGMGGAPSVQRTPQQLAARSYNAGLNHKKRATQYEEKAARAKNDNERDKLLAKARSQYEDSIDDYKKAIGYDNRSHQAFNELGYALRKTGDYQTAVKAYDAALSLQADFAPAIEYRGEAYLALGQLDAAKAAYLTLFRADQDQAATLLNAMETWAAANAASGPDAQAFADWVAERKRVAGQTQSLSMNNTRAWD